MTITIAWFNRMFILHHFVNGQFSIGGSSTSNMISNKSIASSLTAALQLRVCLSIWIPFHGYAWLPGWPISNQRLPHYIFSAGFPGVEAIIRVSTVYFWVFVGLLRPMGSHSYLASTSIFRGDWAFGFLTSSYAMVRTKNDGLLDLAPFDRWIDYVKIYINRQWILGKANKGQNRIVISSRSKTCDLCRSLFQHLLGDKSRQIMVQDYQLLLLIDSLTR